MIYELINQSKRRPTRAGFTIVELLVVMSVMTILAGMVMAAMNSAQQDARRARTESQINRINDMVAEIYDQHSRRKFSLQRPDVGYSYFNSNIGGFQAKANHALSVRRGLSQARLILMRDWLRITMPDRRADLSSTPINVDVVTYLRSDPTNTVNKLVDNGLTRADRLNRMFTRVGSLIGAHAQKNNTTVPTSNADAVTNYWSDTHQDSECLYLILKTSSIAGGPAIEGIQESEIGDTDNDGVPEILDPWGQPLGFQRWPAGYWLTYSLRNETNAAVRVTELANRRLELGPDGTDLLRVDYHYFTNPSGHTKNDDDPYNITPIVFSAGPDGIFDMVTRWRDNPSPGAGVPSRLSYGTMPHPLVSGAFYPDPYLGNYFTSATLNEVNYEAATNLFDPSFLNGLVGAYLDENGDEYDNSVDNIFPQQ